MSMPTPQPPPSVALFSNAAADSVRHGARILTAQRHYSALATAIELEPIQGAPTEFGRPQRPRSQSLGSVRMFPATPDPSEGVPTPPRPSAHDALRSTCSP